MKNIIRWKIRNIISNECLQKLFIWLLGRKWTRSYFLFIFCDTFCCGSILFLTLFLAMWFGMVVAYLCMGACVSCIFEPSIFFIWLNASIVYLYLRSNSCWVTNTGHSRLNFYLLLVNCYVVKSIDVICRSNSNKMMKVI